jgi:putative two-component system response regulator
MGIELGRILDWAPHALLGAALALAVTAAIGMRRQRREAERQARGARHAIHALAGRLFEAAQGETCGSAARIARLADRTARSLGRSAMEIEDLRMAAWMRETVRAYLGLVALGPDSHAAFGVVAGLEAGAIDPALIAAEPRLGHDPEDVLRTALAIAACVDEHWDGSGPRRLEGVHIPADARILAVAECWDESVKGRPYRPAIGTGEAAAFLIRECSQRFDPVVVHTFLAVVARDEPGDRPRAA